MKANNGVNCSYNNRLQYKYPQNVNMLKTDKAILDTNEVICKNIASIDVFARGFVSQNILSQVRNFVEYTAIRAFSNGKDVNPYDYDVNVNAIKYIKCNGDLMFLYKFH